MQNRKDFLRTIGAGLGTVAIAASPVAALAKKIGKSKTGKRPNFVVIMSDDVSPDMYGCYGNTEVRTPNIDKMAREGVMFKTAWASAICSPSRALILTGRYANRTGFYYNGFSIAQEDGSSNFLKYHHSFARLLRDAGYATAIAGKWHVGSAPPQTPQGGFEEYCLWSGLKEIAEVSDGQKYQGGYENEVTSSRYWHPGIIKNGEVVDTKADDYGPDIFSDFIMDFIERKKDQPFIAYYPMVAPHGTRKGQSTTPLYGEVGEMSKSSREENDARFVAQNEYIDVIVGRIQAKLDELNLTEDTVIMYLSDNGTAVTAKSRGVERGCRVVSVMSGGPVEQRGATGELMDFSDILPTLIDFAGVSLPDDYVIDGHSLKPFLTGKKDKTRDWIYSAVGTTQLVRTKDYLLEVLNPILEKPLGRFYKTGESRDGHGYENMTASTNPKVRRARAKFDKILAEYPPLTKDHPHFKTRSGKKWMKENLTPARIEKHLHNHKDYQFYNEDFMD